MTGSSDPSSRITLVAIGQGEKVRKVEEGRILWVWRGDEGAEKERLLVRDVCLWRCPALI